MAPPPPAESSGAVAAEKQTARRQASRNYRPPQPTKFLRRAVKGIKIHVL